MRIRDKKDCDTRDGGIDEVSFHGFGLFFVIRYLLLVICFLD